MYTEIPKLDEIEHGRAGLPGWVAVVSQTCQPLKPVIRCNCGLYVGLGLHWVHADGTITASFFHSRGDNFTIGEDPQGCGWHVWLKLRDYDYGDFPPA